VSGCIPRSKNCLASNAHTKEFIVWTVSINLTDREHDLLTQAADKKDISAEATLKQWMRMGQLVDVRLTDGESIMFRRSSGEVYDPFEMFKLEGTRSVILPSGTETETKT
jgi:hypothetical protein